MTQEKLHQGNALAQKVKHTEDTLSRLKKGDVRGVLRELEPDRCSGFVAYADETDDASEEVTAALIEVFKVRLEKHKEAFAQL